MFLIAHNQVLVPKQYFQDIVPAVTDLSSVVGGVFLNKLILDSNNKIIERDQAVASVEPVTRIVVMYFENEHVFNNFWQSDDRHEIWLVGSNYAYFCDSILEIGSAQAAMTKSLHMIDTGKVPDIVKLKKLGLSGRECEILYWIAQGKSNGDIALILNLSVGTVKKHVANTYDKLGIRTRAAATAIAMETILAEESTIQLLL